MHMLWEMDRWLEKYCVAKPKTDDGKVEAAAEGGAQVAVAAEADEGALAGRTRLLPEGRPISSL